MIPFLSIEINIHMVGPSNMILAQGNFCTIIVQMVISNKKKKASTKKKNEKIPSTKKKNEKRQIFGKKLPLARE